MLSVTAPIWLLGLAVIPLIWWLHRLGDPDDAAPVSAAFLFNSRVDETDTGLASSRANPLWLLRAALLALLLLALAGLNWRHDPGRRITVWFDDSLSMSTLDDKGKRIAMAVRRLSAALDESDPAEFQIRVLSDHGRQFDDSILTGERWAVALLGWLDSNSPGSPRIPLALPRDGENWLVTDGADQRVNAWLSHAAFSRMIAVGSETENAAVTALMARRALQKSAPHQGSVRVHNLGAGDARRTLTVQADGQVIFNENLVIAPGGAIHRSLLLPPDAARVDARLEPADALTLDDTLELDLNALRPLSVDFDSRCGPRLGGALNAHPGLDLRAGTEQDNSLTVRCGPSPGVTAVPSITVHTASNYQAVTAPVFWHQQAQGDGAIPLDPSWLLINPDPARPPSDLTLLSSPGMGRSLIDAQAGAIDVFLDFESAPIVERPEYPLLVNTLVELAVARPVLDPVVRATRSLDESRIARQSQAPVSASSPAAADAATVDLTLALIALAMLLLLIDIFVSLPAGTAQRSASRGSA